MKEKHLKLADIDLFKAPFPLLPTTTIFAFSVCASLQISTRASPFLHIVVQFIYFLHIDQEMEKMIIEKSLPKYQGKAEPFDSPHISCVLQGIF